MKRRTNQHVTLTASATLISMLCCAPLFAESPAQTKTETTAVTNSEQVEADQPPPSVKWGDWTLKADEISVEAAAGHVVATYSMWTVRAESARMRSAGSTYVIEFRGQVRLARADQGTPMVVGASTASVDSADRSVTFTSSKEDGSAFLTRASGGWILHADNIVIRLDDGEIELERIEKMTSKNKSTRAASLR